MLNKPFDSLQKSDIEDLIACKVSEQKHIEYKRDLPGNTEADKVEFVRDITSFANAGGGDILFGISDCRDANGNATGVPDEGVGLSVPNTEAQVRRLEDLLRNGVSPRISGLQFKVVGGFANGPIIILRVPRSWHGPHMVTLGTKPAFFSRSANGKFPLDLNQIRFAFANNENLTATVRSFLEGRIGKILADDTPVPLAPNPKTILHVLPLSQFDAIERFDLIGEINKQRQNLTTMSMTSSSYRHNLDGILVSTANGEPSGLWGYTQVYRQGGIESVDAYVLRDDSDQKAVASKVFEEKIMSALGRFLSFQKGLGIESPILVQLTLIGVRGYRVAVTGTSWIHTAFRPRSFSAP